MSSGSGGLVRFSEFPIRWLPVYQAYQERGYLPPNNIFATIILFARAIARVNILFPPSKKKQPITKYLQNHISKMRTINNDDP